MFANKYKINISTIASGATATTINVPITMTFQNVDNAELIERVFVDTEVEYAINPIKDYEKVRFIPLDLQGNHIDKITYDIYLLDSSGNYKGFYGDIGFVDDDVKFRKQSFKQTFLNLSFYDSDNPLTQNLVTFMTLYSELNSSDLLVPTPTVPLPPNTIPGTPTPAGQIPVNFVVENPLINPRGFAEGYHLYDYKSGLKIGASKYLYMKASFRNAKTGKSVNLMVKNTAQPIDKLVHELYTRYKLVRDSTGFYYEIDNTYQGNVGVTGANNVVYNSNTSKVTLYQIKAT
jgi:hypothetical protein